MKIIRLQAENIKKIKAIDISPENNLVKISGKNAQGKTSVLDSILYALAGKKAIPSKPIRDGEEKATIRLDLGEFEVIRTITSAGEYLKVMTKDGAEYGKAQEKLNEIMGALGFDPLEFANQEPKKQVETLTDLLGIQDELQTIDGHYKDIFSERTAVNRELKRIKATVSAEVVKPVEPRVDVSVVSEALEAEREKFRAIEYTKGLIAENEQSIGDIKLQIEDLREKLSGFEESLVKNRGVLKERLEAYNEKDGVELRQKLDKSTEINQIHRDFETHQERLAEVENVEKEASTLTTKLQDLKDKRIKLIQNSKLPLEGLDISEEGFVMYNDIPFNQLSGAERLKVSLSIGMATNPKLRTMRITDGSLLDEDNMKVIEELCDENDFQVFIEVVDSSGKIGYYIEEGEIKN